METMNIELPAAMKSFVHEQVVAGGFRSANEYINRLIREDQQRKASEEIDQKLLESLNDESATPWTADDLESLKRRVRERHPELVDEP